MGLLISELQDLLEKPAENNDEMEKLLESLKILDQPSQPAQDSSDQQGKQPEATGT